MWKKIKGQLGSNPGGLYEDESGVRWYVKFLASKDRMMNELLANKLYDLAGIRVPESKLVDIDGKEGLASKYNPSLSQGNIEDLTGGREGFAIDAWLANWDVVGLVYDNMLVDENKQIHRIDPGGALDYRAQGGRKGPAFGDEVSELDTLRNPDMNETAHSIFGDMSNAEIRQSIDKVLAIPDNVIKRVVMEYGPSNKQELLKKLLARKKYLKKIKPKFASHFLNKQAFVKLSFVSKCPGHRNSKGELAEWCVKSHDTGEIISSHRTKAQAKEHLRQMHIHKGSTFDEGRYFRAWDENRFTKNPLDKDLQYFLGLLQEWHSKSTREEHSKLLIELSSLRSKYSYSGTAYRTGTRTGQGTSWSKDRDKAMEFNPDASLWEAKVSGIDLEQMAIEVLDYQKRMGQILDSDVLDIFDIEEVVALDKPSEVNQLS